MTCELNVHVAKSRMPTPERWAEAIREAGFAVDLDTSFDVERSSGFRPCTYEGQPAGFEYYVAPLTDDDRSALGLPGEYDASITFATGSNLRELASSVVAAAVLCGMVGGQLSDPEMGETVSAPRALDWARATVRCRGRAAARPAIAPADLAGLTRHHAAASAASLASNRHRPLSLEPLDFPGHHLDIIPVATRTHFRSTSS